MRSRNIGTIGDPIAHQPRRYAQPSVPRTEEIAALRHDSLVVHQPPPFRQLGGHQAPVLIPRKVEQLRPRDLEDRPRGGRPPDELQGDGGLAPVGAQLRRAQDRQLLGEGHVLAADGEVRLRAALYEDVHDAVLAGLGCELDAVEVQPEVALAVHFDLPDAPG